ncbi:MAG: three-Cys-motif partner protein TcmP [Candidatus Dormibacteria bacterium]
MITQGTDLPVWSHAKAQLIAEYLRLFVLITKHGTYIDGFAGPQANEECWSARHVLELSPPRLRHFFLCDAAPTAVRQLEDLRDAHPGRDIHILGPGDFNLLVDGILDPAVIGEKEATFCLLDQRTFECRWETVVKLARFKAEARYKIELFYFLANAWLDRAIAASTTLDGQAQVSAWWGSADWQVLRGQHHVKRAELVAERFRTELGYRYAVPREIYHDEQGTRVMYYMIHASDHPDAPNLMARAYASAVRPPAPLEPDLFPDFDMG